MYGSQKADRVVPAFERMSGVLPWDGLRRELLLLAPRAELFLALRGEFARSLAVFSVAGYVLGIGDR